MSEAAPSARRTNRGEDPLEAGNKLGGQINTAARVEGRKDLVGIVEWRAIELERLEVSVHPNVYADADMILAEKPDVVTIATGGIQRRQVRHACRPTFSDRFRALDEGLMSGRHRDHGRTAEPDTGASRARLRAEQTASILDVDRVKAFRRSPRRSRRLATCFAVRSEFSAVQAGLFGDSSRPDDISSENLGPLETRWMHVKDDFKVLTFDVCVPLSCKTRETNRGKREGE